MNVNAEQLIQLLRSAGLRTAPLRLRAHLHVEGFTKKDSDRPVPLRVDILTEEELFGSYRRWVGVVAPIIV